MASVRKRTWSSGGQERTAWVVDFFDQSGKRRLETFKRKKDADQRLTNIVNEVKDGTYTMPRESVTVSEACKAWLDRCRNGTADREPLERSTIEPYERDVRNYIEHRDIGIGQLKLAALNPQVIKAFEDRILKLGGTKL